MEKLQRIAMSPKVLLVEDMPFLRVAFGRLLRMHGFEVREATDGRQALDCFEEFHPQVVLTDLMMPLMDGYELIRTLHDDPATADVPIVAITANATEEARRDAMEAGASAVIHKPFDMASLLTQLRELQVT